MRLHKEIDFAENPDQPKFPYHAFMAECRTSMVPEKVSHTSRKTVKGCLF
jgi:hypothetical protein